MPRIANANRPASQSAPRIMRAAGIAAKLYSRCGGSTTTGTRALAWLGEVSSAQASRWINQQESVPLKRAILIEIRSDHRIRAEDLLSEDIAFSLIKLRLAAPPKREELEQWAALSASVKDRERWEALFNGEKGSVLRIVRKRRRRAVPRSMNQTGF